MTENSGATRTKNWPTVPTLMEIGIDFVSNAPYGLSGPKGLDPRTVKVLHDAFKLGFEELSTLAALAQLDQDPFYLNTEDYRAFAMTQIAAQRRMVEELGLREK